MSKVALYLRLSVDEAGTDESNSIVNQRYLLHHFLDNSSDFQNFQREEFVDDGFSGTSVNRPAFQRLMTRVKSGEIRHIIVKDLSRFMRDYLELGNYLENIFPFLGVRFIALNDQYDSLTSENNGVEIDVPFKNLLNEFYAKDVSEKVKSAMNTMKRSGKNMSWLPPFGYLKDPEDRFKIIIDEDVVHIVRRVFKLCIEGMGVHRIAMLLNEEQTITPAERKMQVSRAKYNKTIILTDEQQRNIWTRSTVIRILKNEAYKGTYLFNIKTTVNGKQIRRPETEWERIENNHEAIVSKETFNQAQIALKSRTCGRSNKSRNTKREVLLSGFVICKNCGHSLTLFREKTGKHYFYCRYCNSQGFSVKTCRSDIMEETVLSELTPKILLSHPKSSKDVLENEINQLKSRKLDYYQRYKENKVNREEYVMVKSEIDEKILRIELELQKSDSPEFSVMKGLTKEVIEKHVDKILVDRLGDFQVLYK